MSESLKERIYEVSAEADVSVSQYGIDIEGMPRISYSTIINDVNSAQYDPLSNTLYIALDPDLISEQEREELKTEIISELLLSYSVDRGHLMTELEEYQQLESLYNSAKAPLEKLLNLIVDVKSEFQNTDRTRTVLPEAIESHADELREGNRERLEYLRDLDFSILHLEAETSGNFEGGDPVITGEDVDFYLDLLEDNFEMLEYALEAKREKKREINETVRKGSQHIQDETIQAASQLVPLERHGNLGSLRGREIDRFLENSEEDQTVKEIMEEVITEVGLAEEDPEDALRKALNYQRKKHSS